MVQVLIIKILQCIPARSSISLPPVPIQALPEAYLADAHLKYLGWALSDKVRIRT